MNKTICDICGKDMAYRTGYEIRAIGQGGDCNRHMCEHCFVRLIIYGEQMEEGSHDTVATD